MEVTLLRMLRFPGIRLVYAHLFIAFLGDGYIFVLYWDNKSAGFAYQQWHFCLLSVPLLYAISATFVYSR